MRTLVILIGLFLGSTVYALTLTPTEMGNWQDDYNYYKRNIRVLNPNDKEKCEKLLCDILKSLDENAKCTSDSDCTLLDQDPFGATVPIRADSGVIVLEKMTLFKDVCDNGSSHSVHNPDLENIPICWKNRCMVKTSMKKVN